MTATQTAAINLVRIAIDVRDDATVDLQTRKECAARALREALKFINRIEDRAVRTAAKSQWFRAFNAISKFA